MKISFYEETNALDYGIAYPWDGLEVAKNVGDCRKVDNSDGRNYTPCLHVMGEVWKNRLKKVEELEDDGIIEPFHFLGIFAKAGWYIPRHTGMRDPTLLTYLGLTGEENRRKLAETFLTPTTWNEYCEEVSPDNCSTPTNVTARAPIDNETEGVMFFSEGLYTGHFRATAINDCDANPTMCHGHFVDFPCGWSTVFQAQAFHNDIALNTTGDEPFGAGYSYPRMIEIWYAANATKSDVIMHWWQPEALYQLFIGTDAEFQKVDLPPATLECLQSRIDIDLVRCTGDFVAEQGSPEGSCDDPDQALMKLISEGLYEEIYDPSIPEARRSPAYDVVTDFNIDGLQLDQIFKLWLDRSVDRYGFDPRYAVCEWVSNNLDYIQSFVPRTYPRAMREDDDRFDALTWTAMALGIVAVVLTCVCCVAAYMKRKKARVRHAQLDFMFLLLAGLLIVSIAAVISAVSNSNAECVSVAWLVNVGYTLELVPLIIKVYTINRLMQAAKQFRKVELKRVSLFGAVLLLLLITVIFMIIWTAIDPPQIVPQYLLTDEENDAGETIVSVTYFCRSDSNAWGFVSLGVQGFLLIVASVLAFQMRNARVLNEAQSLAILIYSHFIFWVLRLVSFVWFEKSDFASAVPAAYSLFLGVDSIASLCIYFIPKLFFKDDDRRRTTTFAAATIQSLGLPQGENATVLSPMDPESAASVGSDEAKVGAVAKEDPARILSALHGADAFHYEGECPHCGREIEQELLLTELEPHDEMTAPVNNANHSSYDQEKADIAALNGNDTHIK